ncbi:MAG: hypothetical protein HYV60_04595, partial [Planctomycetia bacterium]|nr:hypothetical protein [Planctomycetia bacterium]
VWSAALFAVLQIGIADDHGGHTHSICGPWGCGSPIAALVGWHGFWLLLVAPVVGLLIRSWPAYQLWIGGLVLLASGTATLVGIATWEAVTWLPLVRGDQQTYFVQRFLFSVITMTDLPVIPVTLAGIAMCLSARIKKVAALPGISGNDAARPDQSRSVPSDASRTNGRPCILVDTDMTGTGLLLTNLRGVDLRRVKGLTQEQLDEAIIDQHTQVPDYLRNKASESS